MTARLLTALLFAVPPANLALGTSLAWRFVRSALHEVPTRHWFWLWAVGLVLSLGGFIGFMQGGIWAVLLGTILYVIAALRSRYKQVMPPLS